MEKQYDLIELLEHIDPSRLDYQDWVNVGMALKDAGFTAADWDNWSRRDARRYHPGECFRKWGSFQGSPNPVTAGTLVALAKDQGWSPERSEGHELTWDAIIGSKDELVVVDKNWVEGQEVTEPEDWQPEQQLLNTYLFCLKHPKMSAMSVIVGKKTVSIYQLKEHGTGQPGSSYSSLIIARAILAASWAITSPRSERGFASTLWMDKALKMRM